MEFRCNFSGLCPNASCDRVLALMSLGSRIAGQLSALSGADIRKGRSTGGSLGRGRPEQHLEDVEMTWERSRGGEFLAQEKNHGHIFQPGPMLRGFVQGLRWSLRPWKSLSHPTQPLSALSSVHFQRPLAFLRLPVPALPYSLSWVS